MAWRCRSFVQEIDELRVYPNPVEASFEGWVTVEGLAYNSAVHITTLSGRAVATVQSQGGRAVWDTRLHGAWSPMVYMVFATDATGASADDQTRRTR